MITLFNYEIEVMKIITPIIYILIGVVAYEIIRYFIGKAVKKGIYKNSHQKKRTETVCHMLVNLIKYLIVVVIILAILANFGVNVGTLVAGLGVTAALIGLAFQDVAKDLIAGFSIIIEDLYEIGDTIEVDGFMGEVVALGLKTTKIRNYKGATKIVANRNVQTLINYNLHPSLAVIDVAVDYDADIEKVLKVLEEMATRLNGTIDKAKGDIQILGINDLESSGVVYRVTLETASMEQYRIERILRKEIKEALDKAKIKIPYQQIEVHNGK